MKKIFIMSSLIVTTLATPSFATSTELDKRTVASKAYVDTKQDMIPGTDDYYSVLTDTDDDGVVGKIHITTAFIMENQGLTLQEVSDTIPTSDAVWYELDSNWQPKINAGTAGNVVTYTGTAGTVGSVAVSSTEDYNQQNELTNGSNLANVQLVSTKQNKMACAGWDSETHTDEHCWLWSIE